MALVRKGFDRHMRRCLDEHRKLAEMVSTISGDTTIINVNTKVVQANNVLEHLILAVATLVNENRDE